ncbi:hypothetical protein BOX15_Mlig006820g3 [Macrostomum lignano]|uniref:Adapter molecule Crk n=1 Tax=Macrostomum lignano TaxID=282301 RepID=A0A267E300_9PLAT|nr:hypothetical protein BOX15_Mlig006820g3 [Macrostomum lignano]
MMPDFSKLGMKGTEDWYFGSINREQANEILLSGQVGMYLVRASKTERGSFVLSVRDTQQTNHYKIVVLPRKNSDGFKFRIGPTEFLFIQDILNYYKKNKLVDSTLTVPAPRPVYRVKIDYRPDSDASAIGLRRNECVLFLDVATKPDGAEDAEWWHVLKKNTGEVGCVPKSCLRQSNPGGEDGKFAVLLQLNLPFDVEVVRPRNPNIFDPSQLRMEPGDHIRVKKMDPNSPELWYGVNLRTKAEGVFPFNYVRPLSQEHHADHCRHSGLSSNSAASCRPGNRVSQASGCTLDEYVESTAVAL